MFIRYLLCAEYSSKHYVFKKFLAVLGLRCCGWASSSCSVGSFLLLWLLFHVEHGL